MIIVSGEPRSGTTIMMKILEYERFDPACKELLNSDYELPRIVKNGLSYSMFCGMMPTLCPPIKGTGDTLKLLTPALLSTSSDIIDQIVFVIRDPREIIISQRGRYNENTDNDNWSEYINNMMLLLQKMTANDWKRTVVVDHYDIIRSGHPLVNKEMYKSRVEKEEKGNITGMNTYRKLISRKENSLYSVIQKIRGRSYYNNMTKEYYDNSIFPVEPAQECCCEIK